MSTKKFFAIQKLQNGHIGGNELTNGSQTAISPKQAGAKQSPSSKQTSEKHEAPKAKVRQNLIFSDTCEYTWFRFHDLINWLHTESFGNITPATIFGLCVCTVSWLAE